MGQVYSAHMDPIKDKGWTNEGATASNGTPKVKYSEARICEGRR
jgi:hypothetical protein